MAALALYPKGWTEESADMQDWLTESFASLQKFVKQTTDRGKALVVWIQ